MKYLAALLLPAALSFAAQSGQQELDWLAGCWITPDKTAQEVWVIDRFSDLPTGFSVYLNDGAVGFYELLSIEQPEEGGPLVYTAYPAGQSPTSFTATVHTENSALFVNPQHDYPQEILYTRDSNQLMARISLVGGERAKALSMLPCE